MNSIASYFHLPSCSQLHNLICKPAVFLIFLRKLLQDYDSHRPILSSKDIVAEITIIPLTAFISKICEKISVLIQSLSQLLDDFKTRVEL